MPSIKSKTHAIYWPPGQKPGSLDEGLGAGIVSCSSMCGRSGDISHKIAAVDCRMCLKTISSRTLRLSVVSQYFHEIKSGEKTEEYRLINPYWRKRLQGKEFDYIEIALGYPSRDDKDRRILLHWRGFTEKRITHDHFGSEPVDVFAIDVSNKVPLGSMGAT